MKSIANAALAYRVSKFVLAVGTAALLFTIGAGMVESPIFFAIVGIAFSVIGLIAFDGGFDYLEDVGRYQNGQDAAKGIHMTKPQITMHYALGISGVLGSIFISILASGLFAEAVTVDKSGVVTEMEQTTARADKTYNAQLKAAQQSLATAQQQHAEAKANRATARQTAIDAIGGEFATLMRNNNAWAKTAPETAAKRRQVAKAEQAAQAQVDAAAAGVAEAQRMVNKILIEGRAQTAASIAPVIAAQTAVLDRWTSQLRSTRNLFIRFDLLFGVLAVALYFFLRNTQSLPDERTILELIVKIVRVTGDAFVYALSIGVDNAEKAVNGKIGFVAHPLPIPATLPIVAPQFVAPVLPPDTDENEATNESIIMPETVATGQQKQRSERATKTALGKGNKRDKLRRKIAQYKRRAVRGELSEKGQQTLLQYERELAAMKNSKA